MIRFILGDITKEAEHVDVIVNAANNFLAEGGGVDGAIRRAAGEEALREACREIGWCKTGEAVITEAFNLPCKAIIHAVGPIFKGSGWTDAVLLYVTYLNSLELAYRHGYTRIAFPSISTGAYHFPIQRAAEIAIDAAAYFPEKHPDVQITWVLFDEKDYGIYLKTCQRLYPQLCTEQSAKEMKIC